MDYRGKKILIIDDEQSIRNSLKNFLEDYGYEVEEAENGIRGLECFDQWNPDLVLCDLRMPEMDGLEVLGAIVERSLETPVVIVSGVGNVSDTVGALRLGAWDYLIKPIRDLNVLYHSVEKNLERATLIKEKAIYQRNLERANHELLLSLETLETTRDQLVQSEKMAALGGLVAGVAHEINTPVGIGVTAASFIKDRSVEVNKLYSAGELKRSDLESYIKDMKTISSSILVNMERAAELISSFKQVAVDQNTEEKRIFQVKQCLDNVLLSLEPSCRNSNIKIETECRDDLKINSYPGALSQIFSNLFMNSMIHGFKEGTGGSIWFYIMKEEDRIVITYRDDGAGMGQEQVEKIFEPFYTTIRGKGGTGLGMSIVYNTVTRKLGGTIDCFSEPGQGVEFKIIFPIEY